RGVRGRDRRARQGGLPRQRRGAPLPHRLAGAFRPGDDRVARVRDAGARLRPRLGAGGDRARHRRLDRRERGRGGRRARAPRRHRPRGMPAQLRGALHLGADGARLPAPLRPGGAPAAALPIGAPRRRMKDITPLEEAIRVGDRRYVLATSSREGDPIRVLKYGESFALFDRFGDMPRAGSGEHGLYHEGTRFLSRYELRLNGKRPILLHSSVRRDNSVLSVDGTNPDLHEDGRLATVKGTLHLARSWVLWKAGCHERLRIENFGQAPVRLALTLEFGADYVDIFEVR